MVFVQKPIVVTAPTIQLTIVLPCLVPKMTSKAL